jgi:hypothetical protein
LKQQDNLYRPKPSDFHPFEGYQSDFVRDFFSISLITFGFTNFFKVSRIKKFDIFSDFIKSGHYTDQIKFNKFLNEHADIPTNSLLDYILISISFENYFKAKLLQNGFLIHEIIKEKNPELFKSQRKQPIDSKLVHFEKKDECTELKENTLNYGLLLHNKEYNKYYNLDSKTLNYLDKINIKRNSLHLYMSENFELSNAEINNLENLKKIVEMDFAVLQGFLLDKMGGVNNNKLRIKI